MASTALSESEITEYQDTPAELATKIDRLAELVIAAQGRFVTFTGAGISTNAGIPDFRGPQGVWTLKAKGLAPTKSTSTAAAKPTFTHMALVGLLQSGRMSYVVSQNCDGLHLRSGVPPESISELHGNCNVEACPECGEVYWRPERCRAAPNYECLTGRKCRRGGCSGQLRYTTVAFGQSMPDLCLERAEQYSKQAKLCLTLGTSMRVQPACSLPLIAKKRKQGHLCIVNYQKTPYDDDCDVRIFADCDRVMQLLCERLGQVVPPVGDLLAETDQDKLKQWYTGFKQNWTFRRPDPAHTWCSKPKAEKPKKPAVTKPPTSIVPTEDVGGFVEPKHSCPHIAAAVSDSPLALEPAKELFNIDHQCHHAGCTSTEELWFCLNCFKSHCGRYQRGHGLEHSQSSPHCRVSMSLSDLNTWCYTCDGYVLSDPILPHYVVLHLAKFGRLPPGFQYKSK